MKEYFARLSSSERRFVVAVLMVFFIVLNAWFIWPRFGDWNKYKGRKSFAQSKVNAFETKIAKVPAMEAEVRKLESEGSAVQMEDQASDFLRTIQNQAQASAVGILTSIRQPARTNQFFIELSQGLTVQSGEEQLVDFLYKLGSGNSLVRVRGLSLGPDAPRQNLRVNVTLVGSYLKKAPVRAASAANTNAPAPAATTPKPPAAPGVPSPSKPTTK